MTIDPEKKTCVLCNTEGDYYVMGSAFVAGSPDLDTRPPETRRSAKQEGASTAILVEILRRSGRRDDARKAIAQRPHAQAEEGIVAVLRYQERLIEQGDTDCHTMAEAFGDDEASDNG